MSIQGRFHKIIFEICLQAAYGFVVSFDEIVNSFVNERKTIELMEVLWDF